MSTSNRDESSATPPAPAGRALRLVRDLPAEEKAPAPSDEADPLAEKRRRSPSALVRMMQNWSDAIDRDVKLIMES